MLDNRPKLGNAKGGCLTATKTDAAMIELIGRCARQDGVAITTDQLKNLKKVYGFVESEDNLLTQAGDQRNLMRYVQADGLRVMALLSRYLEPNEDPVRLIQTLLIEAGYDVPDFDWDEDDEDF